MDPSPYFSSFSPIKGNYTIKGQRFKESKPFVLNDAGVLNGYEFSCTTCHKSRITLQFLLRPFISYTYHQRLLDCFEENSLREWGKIGFFGKFLRCSYCETPFYIGIGYHEPNNGRDVFELVSIYEL